MKKFLNIAKKAAPWIVAVFIFSYLFSQYKPSQIWKAVEHANLLYFLTIAFFYFVMLYLADCFTISKVLTRFGYPVTTRELLPVRGATYLVMNINYPASQAAFAYYLKRTRGIPIFEVLGVFFFIAVIDLFVVLTLAFVGSFFQTAVIRGVDIASSVRTVVLVAYTIYFLQLVFWRKWTSRIFGIKRKFKVVEWIRSKKIFCAFEQATVKDYLKILLLRAPIHISIIFIFFIAIRAFHAAAPFVTVLGTIPVAYLIGTIPITPGGLGTTNVAIVELMRSHITGPAVEGGLVSPEELIFAVTILWMFVNYSLKSITGVLWLQRVSKQLFKPSDNAEKEEAMSETTHLMGDL